MIIEAMVNIELNHEQESRVLIQILARDYARILSDYKHLKANVSELDDIDFQDMKDQEKFLNAIEDIVKCYMEHSEFNRWLRDNGRHDV